MVVRIPAMWKVLDETCGGAFGWVYSTGLGVVLGILE